MWSTVVDAIQNEYNSMRIWPRSACPSDSNLTGDPVSHSAYNNVRGGYPPLRSPASGVHRTYNLRISQRTSLGQDIVVLQGWPSRGGVIELENATPPDFDYLQLDHLDPPLRRDADQTAEDAFCQSLLSLGASWWDSEERRTFVRRLEGCDEEALDAVEADESLKPSRRERGWVRVAWPSSPRGALCVLECEKLIMGRAGGEVLRPRHYAIIAMARTMDERCTVLQRLGARMYASIDEYHGPTFLRAWEDDHRGEKGALTRYKFINPATYGGHPSEALWTFEKPRDEHST